MRVTGASFTNNIYAENNKLNRQLFDVNKQISSGLNIQYSHENPGIFIDTLRLDDEVTTLSQTKSSAQNASKLSTQTDTGIGEIVKTLESIKVKLINAANDVHSESSLLAISKELRGLQNHLVSLANTSIGGQYIFSGTATTIKPIDENGNYQGNDKDLFASLGAGIKQKYNITGSQLFFGAENTTNRMITTNVPNINLTDLYGLEPKETYIKSSDTIGDLMGDTLPATGATSHFYIEGKNTDGASFKKHLTFNNTDSVDALLDSIRNEYGADRVNVSMNTHGQIEITDKIKGSSKLDFHMVGAIDFNTGGVDAANVGIIDNLQAGTTDYLTASNLLTPGLYVKEFTKSGFTTPAGVSNLIEGVNYDRTNFTQSGSTLLSNVSQIVNSDNSFALPSTKLLDVASTQPVVPPLLPTLNGEQLILSGKNISGAAFTMQIDLNTAGSTFSLDGGVTNYTIFDTNTPRTAVNADTMTYQQLLDVANMVLTNSLPATTATVADYDTAIATANTLASVSLDHTGKIKFSDKTTPTTKAQISLYDAKSSDYTITTGGAFTFNANNALTIRDPKTDFFKQIEEMIRSVEEGKKFSNGLDNLNPRNVGVQNSIQMIDDLHDHITRLQSEAGSYSQTMDLTISRTDLLIISTKTLRSDVIDTDMAEAALKMQQLSLNYQALLANISKVSKLSLVNYL